MRLSLVTVPALAVALAVGALPTGANAAGTAATAAAAAPSLTIAVPSDSTEVGAANDVTVTLAPAAGRKIEIQISWTESGWTTVDRVRTGSGGTATGTWTAYVGDDFRVRAVAPPQGGSGRLVSNVRTVTAAYGNEVPPDDFDPMTPGRLTIRPAAQRVVDLGEYRIRVGRGTPARGFPRGAGAPDVVATDKSGRVAWASDPGSAFVGASRTTLNWIFRSTAGAFWPVVTRSARLTAQSITSVRRTGAGVVIAGEVRGGGERAPYTVTMTQDRQRRGITALDLAVRVGRTSSGRRIDSVMVTSGRSRNAAVHGMGEQFRPFDLDGTVLPILVQEQGVTRGELPAAPIVDAFTWSAGNLNTTYAPWPSYVTGQKRSFELADDLPSGAFAVADLTRPRQISLESYQPSMTAQVVAARTPKQLMAARGAASTRPELADWVQRGAVLGLQGGTKKVRRIVGQMQRADAKVSGVWLQDWVGKRVTSFGEQLWWTWQLNRERYPGWNRMVRDFNRQGIRVMTYINPFVIDVNRVDGRRVKNYVRIGERKGYLVKNQRGGTYVVETVGFPTAMVDLTNPKARDWFADIIAKNVLGVGADGFMADFGEYLPFDAVVKRGTALQQHNRYPRLWARTVREGCRRGGVPDCVAFFRAGYTGSSKDVPLWWAGDQMVNYAEEDGLRSAVKGMLAAGVSGAPLWHSDIGGYTSVNTGVVNFLRPPNLNARWGEMQAFGVVMRSHESNRPPLNQQIYSTPQTRREFAKSSRIYAALHDYRKGVIDEAVADGVPAMRHTWLVHPGSRAARNDLQFFLGEHLFVAPVYDEDGTSVRATFPPGRWRHILTGRVYSGRATVPAPIGTPAAFVEVGDPVGKRIIAAMKKADLYR